jgi:hypothetical protein
MLNEKGTGKRPEKVDFSRFSGCLTFMHKNAGRNLCRFFRHRRAKK